MICFHDFEQTNFNKTIYLPYNSIKIIVYIYGDTFSIFWILGNYFITICLFCNIVRFIQFECILFSRKLCNRILPGIFHIRLHIRWKHVCKTENNSITIFIHIDRLWHVPSISPHPIDLNYIECVCLSVTCI